jgi:hypothetical protein
MNMTVVKAMCQDLDGCSIALMMVNHANDGVAAQAVGRMHMSASTNAWRVEMDRGSGNGEGWGVDGDGALQEYSSWDCYITDGESTGSNNARADSGAGLGILNCAGCAYSDTTTTCRLVVSD